MGGAGGRALWRGVLRAGCAAVTVTTPVAGGVAGAGWPATAAMATAVGVVAATAGWWPRTRRALGTAVILVATVSALGTVLTGAGAGAGASGGGGDGPDGDSPLGLPMLVEFAAVTVLVFLVARYVPTPRSVLLMAPLTVSGSTVILRMGTYHSLPEAFGQCAFMALGPLGAATVGGRLRALETRRLRAVRAARRAQRLELARDLHDFVAHDVSGIVVLAQAARLVGSDRPEKVPELLERIEAAGLRALASMDRTVHMLSESAPHRPHAYGLADIADVVEHFRSVGGAGARLELDPATGARGAVPHEVAATAHRVVVEALTNVRRHAPGATAVRVRIALDHTGRPAPVLTVEVANGPGSRPTGRPAPERRRGGTGLTALTERVRALGGTLTAGPRTGGGWQTAVTLPLPPPADDGSTPP